jgi:multidrug efflux system membrane fusion protein
VQLGPQSTFVYVVKKDQTVELRNVKAGAKEGSQTAIDEGINPGDIVVTDGVDKLVQGTKVVAHEADANGGATTKPAHGSSSRPARSHSATRPAAEDGGQAQ